MTRLRSLSTLLFVAALGAGGSLAVVHAAPPGAKPTLHAWLTCGRCATSASLSQSCTRRDRSRQANTPDGFTRRLPAATSAASLWRHASGVGPRS